MIVMENVFFAIQDQVLINDISLHVEQGSSVMIMGRSGSGKSLLMKVMAGILPPNAGSVRLEGKDIRRLSDPQVNAMRKHHGFMFQDAALWQNMTVLQNLLLPLQVHQPRWDINRMKERIDKLCSYVRFDEDLSRRPVTLSSGEKKLASLIRALVLDPKLVFYDEPRSGLDVQSHDQILQLLKDQKSQGKTQIIASHDSEIASMIADFLIVIDNGNLIAFDTVRNLTGTEDRHLREILSGVLDLSSSYDSDILEILGSEDANPFG